MKHKNTKKDLLITNFMLGIVVGLLIGSTMIIVNPLFEPQLDYQIKSDKTGSLLKYNEEFIEQNCKNLNFHQDTVFRCEILIKRLEK